MEFWRWRWSNGIVLIGLGGGGLVVRAGEEDLIEVEVVCGRAIGMVVEWCG